MKKLMVMATIGMLSVISLASHAKGHGQRGECHPGKIFVEGMDLSAEQQDLVKELRENRKENFHGRKGKHAGQRLEWMEDFVSGDLEREDIHSQIDQMHGEKTKEVSEMQAMIFELLESYSAEQKAQLSTNLDSQKECMEKMKEKREEYAQKGKHGGPAKRLFKDIELDDDQEESLKDLEEMMKEFHSERRGEHKEMMQSRQVQGALQRRRYANRLVRPPLFRRSSIQFQGRRARTTYHADRH